MSSIEKGEALLAELGTVGESIVAASKTDSARKRTFRAQYGTTDNRLRQLAGELCKDPTGQLAFTHELNGIYTRLNQLKSLVDQMPENPDALSSLNDHVGRVADEVRSMMSVFEADTPASVPPIQPSTIELVGERADVEIERRRAIAEGWVARPSNEPLLEDVRRSLQAVLDLSGRENQPTLSSEERAYLAAIIGIALRELQPDAKWLPLGVFKELIRWMRARVEGALNTGVEDALRLAMYSAVLNLDQLVPILDSVQTLTGLGGA